MASTHKAQIGTWMSKIPQAAYGTIRPNSDTFRRIISNDQNVIEIDTAFADDAGYDIGTDLANDKWALTNDTSIQIPWDFCFQDLGYWLHLALGGYAVVTSGTQFIHTFTPQNADTSRQLPQRTFGKKYGGIKVLIMRDGVCTNLTITGGKTDRIKCSSSIKGSGHYLEDPAGYAQPTVETDREWGYNQQAKLYFNDDSIGTKEVDTLVVTGSVTTAGNAVVVVTAAGMKYSPITVQVAVALSDTATIVAGKVRTALTNHPVIGQFFTISGSGANVVFTKNYKEATDATIASGTTINNGTCAGLTLATATNTTPGVAGSYQNYSCEIESWTITLDNPEADPGYRVCSDFLVIDQPKSGAIRAEYLMGQRKYTVSFECRLNPADKMRGWLTNGTDVKFDLPISGTIAGGSSARFTHTRARVVEAKETIVGEFIGLKGTLDLMASLGTLPFTAVIINGFTSYIT